MKRDLTLHERATLVGLFDPKAIRVTTIADMKIVVSIVEKVSLSPDEKMTLKSGKAGTKKKIIFTEPEGRLLASAMKQFDMVVALHGKLAMEKKS